MDLAGLIDSNGPETGCRYVWSEWRDLNSRPPAPEAGALLAPVALKRIQGFICLGEAGLAQQARSTEKMNSIKCDRRQAALHSEPVLHITARGI